MGRENCLVIHKQLCLSARAFDSAVSGPLFPKWSYCVHCAAVRAEKRLTKDSREQMPATHGMLGTGAAA